jgi:23S rRNA pseudouridine1911/1915/1917 synthase
VTSVEETIPAALAGERVDRVTAIITGLSRSAVARLVEAGSVRLGGQRVEAASMRVSEGQHLVIELPEDVASGPVPDPGVDIAVVHVDADVVVVDKPAGLIVHPGSGPPEPTLVGGLLARFPEMADVGAPERPGIVHRLDRGTSGLLVVARSQPAYEGLVSQLKRREPERVYTALVWGQPDASAGTIEAPVGRSANHPTRMTVTPRGREAVTHYDVERRYRHPRSCALLTCRLETGRTHQIRVHMEAIGHPVVGDQQYGGDRPGLDLTRPFLHAGGLAFDHPTTGESLVFSSPLPDDLAAVLATLEG